MRKWPVFSVMLLTAIGALSCSSSSTEPLQMMHAPDLALIKNFGISVEGVIRYQFYQKYGFTDTEEQLILIVKPTHTDFLLHDLPFTAHDKERMKRIDFRKFVQNQPVTYTVEKNSQADILVEGKEYVDGKAPTVIYGEGKYRLIRTDSTETLFLWDRQTGLMYVESKRGRAENFNKKLSDTALTTSN